MPAETGPKTPITIAETAANTAGKTPKKTVRTQSAPDPRSEAQRLFQGYGQLTAGIFGLIGDGMKTTTRFWERVGQGIPGKDPGG